MSMTYHRKRTLGMALLLGVAASQAQAAGVAEMVSSIGPWPIGFGILAMLTVVAFVQEIGSRRRQAIRAEVFGLDDHAPFIFLDAMCHAAAADAKTDREEVDFIRALAVDMTGLDYTPAHIAEAIENTDKLTGVRQFKRFGVGLDLDQKRMVLRGAMSVILSDGGVTKAEQRFLRNLARGLGISKSDFHGMVEGVMGHITAARA